MLVHSCTLSARSSGAILSNASKLLKKYAEHPYLFTISSNAEERELSKLFEGLTSPPNSTSGAAGIGCLAAPLPSSNSWRSLSCSLAFFHPERSSIFRSEIPGTPAPQVGRWNINRQEGGQRAPSLDFAGDAFQSRWSTSNSGVPLPPSLQALRPEEVTDVVYLSDMFPEGLSSALQAFPNSNELGLMATSTPFITGRPVTLFHHSNGSTDIVGKGAVGIALTGKPAKSGKATVKFSGLMALSESMVLTRQASYSKPLVYTESLTFHSCEGNMVNTINGTNPAQLLLNAIDARGLSSTLGSDIKSDIFLLGVMEGGQIDQLLEITAGDPSRGNISLKTDNALVPNTTVQFFYRPSSTPVHVPTTGAPKHNSMEFITTMEAEEGSHENVLEDEELTVVEGRMLAASENGFITGKPKKAAWRCTVPGSISNLSWPLPS